MGLDSIVRSGITTIDGITKSLQVSVTHEAWISDKAGYGEPKFDTPITRRCLIEPKHTMKVTKDGREIVQRFQLTLIAPVSPNGAVGRTEPIDPRDVLTLPDGSTGIIMNVSGLTDPITNRPYMYEVAVG